MHINKSVCLNISYGIAHTEKLHPNCNISVLSHGSEWLRRKKVDRWDSFFSNLYINFDFDHDTAIKMTRKHLCCGGNRCILANELKCTKPAAAVKRKKNLVLPFRNANHFKHKSIKSTKLQPPRAHTPESNYKIICFSFSFSCCCRVFFLSTFRQVHGESKLKLMLELSRAKSRHDLTFVWREKKSSPRREKTKRPIEPRIAQMESFDATKNIRSRALPFVENGKKFDLLSACGLTKWSN